jgi:hypothetical protein
MPGIRRFKTYLNSTLEEAVTQLRAKKISQRDAAQKYNIPRSTLKNKLKGLHPLSVGRPREFSDCQENIFRNRFDVLCEWGFPVDINDVKEVVRGYIERRGKTKSRFRCKIPGTDWVEGFMSRHNLCLRMTSNIKRKRAAVSPKVINEYFDHLEKELDGVAPENIWNYDETNLSDDPGRKKCVVRRGCKYPERIINSSKVGFSVMFCGNGTGEILPPYTVYQAVHLYDQWIEGGLKDARYNRSKSGWFNESTFADWFKTLVLPKLMRQQGPKALIGDNLSSHINDEVIRLCRNHDIKFICLPPNSTHLTQPLDVAYFRPLKAHWRKCLQQWKLSQGGRQGITLPKNSFPPMLKNLVTSLLGGNGLSNLVAGFNKTGICPLNRQRVLDMLPRSHDDPILDAAAVDAAVMNLLKKMRYGAEESASVAQPQRKKARLNVIPGKSVAVADSDSDSHNSGNEEDDSGDDVDDEDEDEDIPKLPVFPKPEKKSTGAARSRRNHRLPSRYTM